VERGKRGAKPRLYQEAPTPQKEKKRRAQRLLFIGRLLRGVPGGRNDLSSQTLGKTSRNKGIEFSKGERPGGLTVSEKKRIKVFPSARQRKHRAKLTAFRVPGRRHTLEGGGRTQDIEKSSDRTQLWRPARIPGHEASRADRARKGGGEGVPGAREGGGKKWSSGTKDPQKLGTGGIDLRTGAINVLKEEVGCIWITGGTEKAPDRIRAENVEPPIVSSTKEKVVGNR